VKQPPGRTSEAELIFVWREVWERGINSVLTKFEGMSSEIVQPYE
jgi:hypothetical protein